MRLKIIELVQQHDDVLAAGGKVCRACGAFGAQSLKLSEYVEIPSERRNVRRGWQHTQQSLEDRLGQESVPKHPD
jgi:hypothetical protein